MNPHFLSQRRLRPAAHLRRLCLFMAVVALSGCASPLPRMLREPAVGDPGVAAVRAAPKSAYNGQAVRWGGDIIETDNRADQTRITILARRLDSDGQPTAEPGGGRFIATVKGFLDPALYQPGRQITVAGHVSGIETHLVGAFAYRYPVVHVDTYYLWPLPSRTEQWPAEPPYWRPYWYDPWYPFYGPGWPYYPY